MLLVTGGAGFIGSNIVAGLNAAGITDIAVNDIFGTGQKWRNLAGRRVADVVPASDLLCWLPGRKLDAVVRDQVLSAITLREPPPRDEIEQMPPPALPPAALYSSKKSVTSTGVAQALLLAKTPTFPT